jgi:hypothetical protein
MASEFANQLDHHTASIYHAVMSHCVGMASNLKMDLEDGDTLAAEAPRSEEEQKALETYKKDLNAVLDQLRNVGNFIVESARQKAIAQSGEDPGEMKVQW